MKNLLTALAFLISVSVFGQGVCNNQSSVTHQGYEYAIVEIGDQCWFAENCRYLPEVSPLSAYSNTEPYYYVYDYQGTDVEAAKATDNYEIYGVLYNWPAVMTEGICPSGWHIPSDSEFTVLTDFLDGEVIAGSSMKSTTGWNSGGNGTNSSGFNGLPGGGGDSDGFNESGYGAAWWSSSLTKSLDLTNFNVEMSSLGSSAAWTRVLKHKYDNAYHYYGSKNFGFSARCLMITDSLFGQTVYTLDQCIYNNDSTLVLDKSNNLPITGLLKKYNENDQLSSELNYKNGVKEGLWKYYYDNGQIMSEGNYKYGNGAEFLKKYLENGQLSFEGYWKNGKFEAVYENLGDDLPFTIVENMPALGDCTSMRGDERHQCTQMEITRYVTKNAQYPPTAKNEGIQGTVSVYFIVGKDGYVTNVRSLRPIKNSLDEEAIRLVSSLPKFEPGTQRGKNVSVEYTTRVTFIIR